MKPDERRYAFEAVVRDETNSHDCRISIVAKTIDEAWEKASQHLIEYALILGAALIGVSLADVSGEIEPVPFEPPYVVESTLWDTIYHRN